MSTETTKINTDLGKLLRVNRSIQAEGVFAMVKEDMSFRRFLLRGMVKIQVEWTLLSLAYNLLKLHHKARTKTKAFSGWSVAKSFPQEDVTPKIRRLKTKKVPSKGMISTSSVSGALFLTFRVILHTTYR